MSETDSSLPTLPAVGFVRLSDVLKLIPVCKTSWYQGVEEGRFPAPVKLTRRSSAYRVEDIRALIARLSSREGA